ncbi:MAG: hydroxyphenylacetyl-CoA thioesterase PaaI [Rhizobiaceae bacterium]|nr:hydroxyphenylacetyl-CoA thioesterase PaaI [Rhizobiaceae bacterium]
MNDSDQLAKACADTMWANDQASQGLGTKIDEIRQGYAVLSMPIREDMLNGQKITHGGFVFTLADSAFAFACNTYNQFAVAQHCSVTFIAPTFLGDRLKATATERNRSGRSGIYDVTVTNQNGEVIAEFRGNSRTVKGQHVAD